MLRKCEALGISQEEFEAVEAELRLHHSAHKPLTARDVVWRVVSDRAMEARLQRAFDELATLERARAWELFEQGEDHSDMLAEANRARLRALAQASQHTDHDAHVAILPGCCAECDAQPQRVYLLDEALAEMPLPHRDCSRSLSEQGATGWCSCTWAWSTERLRTSD